VWGRLVSFESSGSSADSRAHRKREHKLHLIMKALLSIHSPMAAYRMGVTCAVCPLYVQVAEPRDSRVISKTRLLSGCLETARNWPVSGKVATGGPCISDTWRFGGIWCGAEKAPKHPFTAVRRAQAGRCCQTTLIWLSGGCPQTSDPTFPRLPLSNESSRVNPYQYLCWF
jgi:hypothetical protein